MLSFFQTIMPKDECIKYWSFFKIEKMRKSIKHLCLITHLYALKSIYLYSTYSCIKR